MSTRSNNFAQPGDDQQIARLLHAIESGQAGAGQAGQSDEFVSGTASGSGDGIQAMRQDRAALRSALKADLETPLPAQRQAQFAQLVRDEIDRGLLADLSTGAPLQNHLPISLVKPVRRTSHHAWSSPVDSKRLTRFFAVAATLSLFAGVAWLAMQRPAPSRGPLVSGSSGGPRELPSWATLPAHPARAIDPATPALAARFDEPSDSTSMLEPTFTRDSATALAWAKRGVLAVRITTDSPRRDRERLDNFAQASSRTDRWSLSTSPPPSIGAIPARPWPIETGMAGISESGFTANARPDSATLAAFGLMLRPTTDAIESARAALEDSLAGTVIFERVDTLAAFAERPQPEPAPDSAIDILWWTKPASEWSPRIRVPVLVEFGTPERKSAVPGSAPAK